MIKALYGTFKLKKISDYFILPFKVIYLLYTFPFLIFLVLASIRGAGAFGNLSKKKLGVMEKILLHFAAIVISFLAWISILIFLKIKIRLHLFKA